MTFRQSGNDNSKDFDWIEILLNIGIPDGRHRIIATVLAPYLINVKNLEVSATEKVIQGWIEKCERYEPIRGNISAFITRSCLNAYRLRKKPKDLDFLKVRHPTLYREIVSLANSYTMVE
jgi:hypothetical protein